MGIGDWGFGVWGWGVGGGGPTPHPHHTPPNQQKNNILYN